jgi:hypothetical protein
MFDETIFWQANIWGIAGVIIGITALFISLSNRHRSKPRIAITALELVRKNPLQISEWYGHKMKEQMHDHILDFNLHITLKNKGGGSGSIEVPRLVLSIPSGQKGLSGEQYKNIIVEPKMSSGGAGMPDKGTAWKLGPGEILNDEARYVIENMDDLYELVYNYSFIRYSIEYSDSGDKAYAENIVSVVEEK